MVCFRIGDFKLIGMPWVLAHSILPGSFDLKLDQESCPIAPIAYSTYWLSGLSASWDSLGYSVTQSSFPDTNPKLHACL